MNVGLFCDELSVPNALKQLNMKSAVWFFSKHLGSRAQQGLNLQHSATYEKKHTRQVPFFK